MRHALSLIPLLAVTGLGGCVIYDNDTRETVDRSCVGPNHGGAYDTGYASDQPDTPNFWLSPDTAAPGDVFIASLQSDQAEDFAAIVDVSFMGDISICTTSARDDELLLTISVPDDAISGNYDLVVRFEDGSTYWVDGALTVTAEGSSGGSSGSAGSSGGADTGGSGSGSSSSGACG